jgi:hypothetical protein
MDAKRTMIVWTFMVLLEGGRFDARLKASE